MGGKKVKAVYFSATGTTKKITEFLAERVAALTETEPAADVLDFTLPEARKKAARFSPNETVIFGTPVYAGRVPNVLLSYLNTIEGNNALAIPIVLYGNRNYDDALIELRNLLEAGGFHTVAGAAFVGEHSFSRTLAAGRPDRQDFSQAETFAQAVAQKLKRLWEEERGGNEKWISSPVQVKGQDPIRGYYQPRDRKGEFIDIRKVLPKVDAACDDCGLCAAVCPMGSIDPENVRSYTGICIKCGACIKRCPKGARYYDDPGYLYHKTELEEGFARRAEPEFFL